MTSRYRKHPQTAARVIGGTAFVVTADDNVLHTLNESGTALWRVASEECSTDDAVALMVREYEVDESTARRDIEDCLAEFVSKGLLVEVPG